MFLSLFLFDPLSFDGLDVRLFLYQTLVLFLLYEQICLLLVVALFEAMILYGLDERNPFLFFLLVLLLFLLLFLVLFAVNNAPYDVEGELHKFFLEN